MIVPGMQVGVRMRVAEQDASEEHRDRSEGGDASCDVRLLEDGRDQFDDMEHAMRNQGPFKQLQERMWEGHVMPHRRHRMS